MKQVQDVDLKLLRTFVEIVNSGGFSAAQSVLNIGQSTISEYMNQLETRLGVKLCSRGRSGFQLSEPGRKVYNAALQLLRSVEEFRIEATHLAESLEGELRIGLIDNTITNAEFRFVDAVRKFNNIAEKVRIYIQVLSPHELEQSILNGRIHVAVSPCPIKISGICYEELFTELHLVYCGIGHPFFKQEPVLEDICKNKIVVHGYEHEVDLKMLNASTSSAVVNNMEAEALLIMTGRYIGFLPAHYAQHWVDRGELKPVLSDSLHYESPFYLMTKSGDSRSQVMDAFLEHFRACMRDLPPKGQPTTGI
ncbi:LysR family transcriptional regulator [Sansalvadorimonas verongulae]|uniref:LysR family transcriptional regulator n=1 Tax=Sansalvadorimonas verongulae TaxID=2172824 RepID=UPI0012BBDFA9|nr:LysR family transcriptional regulator [Sansalvadorimonas verongulae]MTI15084.1 LysR family transcriptional regulator [Sansalvadorimonas verongulae]